ncbi:MAG TPA: hypothetical protein VNE39_13785 [Planctomycetota bacterium]|nr:hypothetical protein [Planctomycetota bacterium]
MAGTATEAEVGGVRGKLRALKDRVVTGTKKWGKEHPGTSVGIIAGVSVAIGLLIGVCIGQRIGSCRDEREEE